MTDSLKKTNTPVVPPTGLIVGDVDNQSNPVEMLKTPSGWIRAPFSRIVHYIYAGFHYFFNKQAQEWERINGLYWGTLLEDLYGKTNSGAQVKLHVFEENGSKVGVRGGWIAALDPNGIQISFVTVDRVIPTSKKLPAGSWVGCDKVGAETYCVVVSECPVPV